MVFIITFSSPLVKLNYHLVLITNEDGFLITNYDGCISGFLVGTTEIGLGVSSGSTFPNFMFSQAGSDLFDFSLLPAFDAARKYFGLSAFYGLSIPEGFFFELKYLK